MSVLRKHIGRFELLKRIGMGGMAEVFLALDREKPIAIKVLLPALAENEEIVSSFIDEAHIAAELSHPNIVTVFDFGQIDDDYFIAMEYVDGWDLRHVINHAGKLERRLPIPACAYVVHEVALALDYVHKHPRGIVHRDVTPHNIFVTRDGHVKLGDFGVAKARARIGRTLDGQIKGKLAYLAPEQLAGDEVSPRTDVYGAGLVLFELVTGRRLIEGATHGEIMRKAMEPPRVVPSSINPAAAGLDRVLQAALEPHPTLRTRDAELLADDLERYLAVHPFDAARLGNLVSRLLSGDARAGVPAERATGSLPQIDAPGGGGGAAHGTRAAAKRIVPDGTQPAAKRVVPDGTQPAAKRPRRQSRRRISEGTQRAKLPIAENTPAPQRSQSDSDVIGLEPAETNEQQLAAVETDERGVAAFDTDERLLAAFDDDTISPTIVRQAPPRLRPPARALQSTKPLPTLGPLDDVTTGRHAAHGDETVTRAAAAATRRDLPALDASDTASEDPFLDPIDVELLDSTEDGLTPATPLMQPAISPLPRAPAAAEVAADARATEAAEEIARDDAELEVEAATVQLDSAASRALVARATGEVALAGPAAPAAAPSTAPSAPRPSAPRPSAPAPPAPAPLSLDDPAAWHSADEASVIRPPMRRGPLVAALLVVVLGAVAAVAYFATRGSSRAAAGGADARTAARLTSPAGTRVAATTTAASHGAAGAPATTSDSATAAARTRDAASRRPATATAAAGATDAAAAASAGDGAKGGSAGGSGGGGSGNAKTSADGDAPGDPVPLPRNAVNAPPARRRASGAAAATGTARRAAARRAAARRAAARRAARRAAARRAAARRAAAVRTAAQRRRLRALVARAARAGLSAGDLPRYDRARAAVSRALDDDDDASTQLAALARVVGAFRPSSRFVRRKLRRLDRMIARARLGAAARQRMRRASRQILRLVLADRRREASRRISRLIAQLRRH